MANTNNINYNIVIIHDNESIGLGYQETLQNTEDQSYTVHIISTNEHDAFLKIMEVTPELVICCYESAEFNAQRIIKSMMNYPVKQRPGVLIVGPQIEDKMLRQLTLMGASDYLIEPVPVNKLRIKVKNAISSFLFKKEKENSTQAPDIKELLEQYEQAPHDDSYAPKIDLPVLKDKLYKLKKLEWSIDLNEIKQSKDSWLFLAQGPTPEYGNWIKTDIVNKWKWIWSKQVLETFQGEEPPGYFFEGVEPKWAKGKWENGRWVMGGRDPSLSIQGIDKAAKNIINFDNGEPNIGITDLIIPSAIMESLAATNKNEGQPKVIEILTSCNYSKKDIETLLPDIGKLSGKTEIAKTKTAVKEDSSVKKRLSLYDRALSGEFKTGIQAVIPSTLSSPAHSPEINETQLSDQESDTLNGYFDMPLAELSNLWMKSGSKDLFTAKLSYAPKKQTAPENKQEIDTVDNAYKSLRRLNILNQSMDDCKRRLSNIQVTIIDISDASKSASVILTNDTLKIEELKLTYNYFANQIFKDIRQVIKIELTDDKFNAFIYPYFNAQDRLVGVAMFRKNVAKTIFSMNDKIICSALANSIKTAFTV